MSRLPRNNRCSLLGLLAGLLLLVVASVAPAPTKPSLPPKASPSPKASPAAGVSMPTMPSSPAPAPPFTGAALPTPPQQTSLWTPPAGLPGPLVSAATTLFDQGLADPRGGDYRQVSVGVGNVWGGDGGVARTHGWVLPADGPGGGRFAVCWNGLVYPAVSVGGPADLAPMCWPWSKPTRTPARGGRRRIRRSRISASSEAPTRSACRSPRPPCCRSKPACCSGSARARWRGNLGCLAGRYTAPPEQRRGFAGPLPDTGRRVGRVTV